MNPWWFHFFAAGYMACCEPHARYYFMVLYRVGDNNGCSFKMSLS